MDLPHRQFVFTIPKILRPYFKSDKGEVFKAFLRKGLIDQARVNMLNDWKHSGFSIESETRLFSKADREALGQYVVRGATCAKKIQYDQASDTVIWTASSKGFYKEKLETFKGSVPVCCARSPPQAGTGVGIIPNSEVYVEQDNTSKLVLIRQPRRVIVLGSEKIG